MLTKHAQDTGEDLVEDAGNDESEAQDDTEEKI